VQVGNQIEQIEDCHGRVVGVYYADMGGTPVSAEQVSSYMDQFGWDGEGYRISDQTGELWNAMDLWPASPGVFVLRTEDMEIVASEAAAPLDVVQQACGLDD